jgi:hypothetical protein
MNDEIKRLFKSNLSLLKNNELIYLPDWKFLTNDYENIEEKIYNHLISIEYRAKQRIMYEQIDIFKPLLTLIDHATICFYQSNYICAYFTIAPIIEGLLRKWNTKAQYIRNQKDFNPRNFVSKFMTEVQNNYKAKDEKTYADDSKILHCYLLKMYIYKLFKSNSDNLFNRHVIAHLLKDPKFFESRANTLKLFCLLNLIAICYQNEYPINSKTIECEVNGMTKYTYEYILQNKNKLFKEFYKLCFNSKTQMVAIWELIKKYNETD